VTAAPNLHVATPDRSRQQRQRLAELLSGQEGTDYFVGPVQKHQPTPYTYRDWIKRRIARDAVGDLGYVRVQFMRRGVKGCGVVLDAVMSDGANDWFHVQENYSGVVGWLPSSKVRACEGDGRCACENAASEAKGSARACERAPAASLVPPGNTGTTVGGEA